jgi:hypothetical protein
MHNTPLRPIGEPAPPSLNPALLLGNRLEADLLDVSPCHGTLLELQLVVVAAAPAAPAAVPAVAAAIPALAAAACSAALHC